MPGGGGGAVSVRNKRGRADRANRKFSAILSVCGLSSKYRVIQERANRAGNGKIQLQDEEWTTKHL